MQQYENKNQHLYSLISYYLSVSCEKETKTINIYYIKYMFMLYINLFVKIYILVDVMCAHKSDFFSHFFFLDKMQYEI